MGGWNRRYEPMWFGDRVTASTENMTKQCHEECTDGYCHRAYIKAPILIKDYSELSYEK